MNSAEAARMWMLLQTEKSLGLDSVPWKLARHPSAGTPLAPPASAARIPVAPAVPPARRPVMPPPQRQVVSSPSPAPSLPQPPAAAPRPMQPVEALKNMPAVAQAPDLPLTERTALMESLDANHVKGCTKCPLCQARKNTVFGEGALDAALMFIGEGPGETEDDTGRPFVGRAGQLLTKMIGAMGLSREQVYIANVVKCRPPGNRTPAAEEVAACTPYLVKQIQAIRPKVIVTLGLPATQYMLSTDKNMRDLRGIWHEWHGIKIMPTYHPSYVLRSYTPQVRGAVWSDLQKVMQELGLSPDAQQFAR